MAKRRYQQLSEDERIEIYRLHADGISRRRIAAALGRSPATISRELRRNSKPSHRWRSGYHPRRAHDLARRRHARGRAHKLQRLPQLRSQVFAQLELGWSPEQIVGRFSRLQSHSPISHESIYRYIYWRSGCFSERLHHLLPRRKHRRGRFHRSPRWSKNSIAHRRSIHLRPAHVHRRRQPGHWEVDLMSFSQLRQHLLVVHERRSRLTLLLRQPDKSPRTVFDNLSTLCRQLPPSLLRSCTFDNGIEFSQHDRLVERFGLATWFCDNHAPWQKGGVENSIGRLRRPLPRHTNLALLSDADLAQLTARFNSTPRKCLGFRTPHEVFFSSGVALQT